MMKKMLFVTVAVICAATLACCGGSGDGGDSNSSSTGTGRKRSIMNIFTPTSSGRAYELLVVIDDGLWERPAGRALFNVLDSDVPGLPQSERSFRIMNTVPEGFNSTLKMLRNIIRVDIDPQRYTQPKFRAESDTYSFPQNILTIQAPDEDSMETYVTKNGQAIIDYFTHAEMNRQIMILESRHNDNISKTCEEMFGCDVWLPGELQSYKKGKDFFWAGTNAATADRNFVIYSYPYTDNRTFTKEFFVHKRDSVMAVNIPGAREGSHMTTDSLLTDCKAYMLNGVYVFEARGLWKITKDMMGGPYVSQARVDTVNQRVIVEEIFVYSPDRAKRNLVRQMEASLYTIKLPGQKGDDAQATIPVDENVEKTAD